MRKPRRPTRKICCSSIDICNAIFNCNDIAEAQQLSAKIIPRSHRLVQIKNAINSGDLERAKQWASKEIIAIENEEKRKAAAHNDKKIENLFKEYVKKHIDEKFSGNFYSGITLLKKKIDYSYHDCKETRDEILAHALDVYMAVYVEFEGEKCYYRVIVYSPTKGFQKSTFRRNIIDKTGKYKKYIPDANLSYQLVESWNYINTTRIISEASIELAKSTGDSSLRSTYIFYWEDIN